MRGPRILAGVLTASLLATLPLRAQETRDVPMLGITRISDPPPAIDGSLDRLSSVPNVVEWHKRRDIVYGPARWTGSEDLSGRLFLGWDANFLYVAADVTDDRIVQRHFGSDLWHGDHLEVFLDVPRQPAGDRDKTRVIQIGLSPGNFAQGEALIRPEAFMWSPKLMALPDARIAAAKADGGYRIEAALPWSALGVAGPVEGLALGVDVTLSDADQPADAAQESMASLVAGDWSLRNPNRMREAALADANGKIDRSKIRSGFEVVRRDIRVEPGKAVTVAIKPARQTDVKELIVKPRLEHERIAGGNPVLRLAVNGTPLEMDRVRNRLKRFDMGPRQVTSYTTQGWFVFFAADYTPAPPFTAYAVQGVEQFVLRFDVSDIWKPGRGNEVTIEHSNPDYGWPLIVELGVSSTLSAKMLPPRRRPAPTGEILSIIPHGLAKPPYRMTVLEGGAIRVALAGRQWIVESAFSTLAPGWAKLGADADVDRHWRRLRHKTDGVVAVSDDFRLERTVVRRDDHVFVTDRIINTGDNDLPVMVRHYTEMGDGVTHIRIGGKPIGQMPRMETENGAHPASLALYEQTGIALLSEDDVMRAQARNFRHDDVIGISNPRLVVRRATSLDIEFSIYPLDEADPFTFVNRVRRNWDTNFTIPGSFAFMQQRKPVTEMSDEQLVALLEGKSAKFICSSMGRYKGLWAHGTAYKHADQSKENILFERVKRLRPQTQTQFYFHCFISVHEDDPQNFAADALRRPDGSPGDYNKAKYPIFLPREGSPFAAVQDELIDLRFEQFNLDGIYWDEIGYSAHKYDYSDHWDGYTAIISSNTHRIERKITNVTLGTLSWREKAAKRILARGSLIGNGAPLTRTFTRLHFPRFLETGSITHLYNGQLYTPIALGDHLTERSPLDCYHNMVRGLDYGAVYYWYFDQIVATEPTLTSVMFPITPIELGHGYIIAKERILTNTSGRFGWGDDSDFDVAVFNERGKRTDTIDVPRRIIDGKSFAEVRIAEGYAVALIRK